MSPARKRASHPSSSTSALHYQPYPLNFEREASNNLVPGAPGASGASGAHLGVGSNIPIQTIGTPSIFYSN